VGTEPVWALRGREKSLASAGNRTLVVQPVAHRCTSYAILAPELAVAAAYIVRRRACYTVGYITSGGPVVTLGTELPYLC
jgi:hypothetical protein